MSGDGRTRVRAATALVAAAIGIVVMAWTASPLPQVLGLPLVLAALFWCLVPLPEPLRAARDAIARRRWASWGLPLLLLVGLVCLVYHPLLEGHMPWAAGQADHPTHQYQAWLLVERMLPTGRLTGWSDMRWAGYPALELYPIGGPLWVALWRGLTLGMLDWEATYALAILAMLVANVVAVYTVTRRLSGPWAAALAAVLVLFERGSPRQGGDHYVVDVGVWPVTMGIGPMLLCVERTWSWMEGRAGARALAVACVLACWALLCHPMYLPVLVLAAPCLLAVALARRTASDRAAAAVVTTLVLGLALAAFWYAPFIAHSDLSEPGGAPFRSLGNIGEGIAMATLAPRFWTPALVAALVGVVLALARGGGLAALAALCLVLLLASSSTPLELSESLTELSASVQQERFMIPLRVLLCVLAGHAATEVLGLAIRRIESWTLVRTRLAAVAAIVLATPLVAPGVESVFKYVVVPVLEFDHGDDLQHRRDLLALCAWLRDRAHETHGGGWARRTAWYVAYGHHEYANAPVHCGLAQVIDTPAETFALRPGGISEREVRALGVRWVVSDRPIEGRETYLALRRRVGALHAYEVTGAAPTRVTVLGRGTARIELFEDERIRVRTRGTGPRTRVAVHVSQHPDWVATMNGAPVRISGGHLGLPRADLIHVPVTDGVLELRYTRGSTHLRGWVFTLLGLLTVGLIGWRWSGSRLTSRLGRSRLATGLGRVPPVVRAVAICAAGILVLGKVVTAAEPGVPPRDRAAPVRAEGDVTLADLLDQAAVSVIEGDGEARRRLSRRWDGRFGSMLPPEVIVDRHVEALELGDPRRVVAVRVGSGEAVHVRFPIDGVRGIRGSFARGGTGRSMTRLAVWVGHRRVGLFTHERLGVWRDIVAISQAPAGPLELVVRGSESRGRAVLIDAVVVR